MAARKLIEKRVEKVWGRRDLPDMFGGAWGGDEPLGEIWFEHPGGGDAELLVKYLFTSEKLSIQVHPDDAAARRAGEARGKDEAWIILRAEPGATIGLGLREPVSPDRLRGAALDGSIEALIDWRPVAAGDVIYSPSRTIHAIGPGLTLIEIQQNSDITYRLYDYGRPRELHLAEAVGAANPVPYVSPMVPYALSNGRDIVPSGGAFVVERWSQPGAVMMRASEDRPVWLVPVSGEGTISGERLEPGTVWFADGDTPLTLSEGSELFVAYPGASVRHDLIG
jgi:mannose-6-phosphate isomerase